MVLAVLPTQAKAQEGAASAPDARHATRTAEYANVMVKPGDSLWKISEERLGPNAAPQRIANDVRRIAALNRGRIGADPNLLVVGQELLVPSFGRRSAAKLATPDQGPTEPAEARGPGDKTARTSGTTTGEVVGEVSQTPNASPRQDKLPDAPSAPRTPEVRTPSETDVFSQVAFFERAAHALLSSATPSAVGAIPKDDPVLRRLLGSGIMTLTLLVAGLLAWKAPMKRCVGEEADLWRDRSRYLSEARDVMPPQPTTALDARSLIGTANEAGEAFHNAVIRMATRKRRGRRLRERILTPMPSPRRYLVSDTYSPQVTRHLRRAEGLRRRGLLPLSRRLRRNKGK